MAIQVIPKKRDEICDALRAEVISGQWESDKPVRENTLTKRFGVSRGPIRDALLQLTREGALVYRKNKGVRVGSPPDKEERDLLCRMRRELEVYCIKKAISRWDQKDDRKITLLLVDLKTACDNLDLPKVAEADLALHRHWVSRASKEMEAVWLSISVRMRMAYTRLSEYQEIYQEHESIVEAILRRDLPTTESRLEKNII